MATNLETIERAMRLLTVLDIEASATARQSVIGLKALNQMLTRWEANNLPLGYTTQTDTAATIPVPDEALGAVDYNLACELAPEYGMNPPGKVEQMAAKLYSEALRDAFVVTPNAMHHVPGARSRWNINSDES
jgi:hypothetical protein